MNQGESISTMPSAHPPATSRLAAVKDTDDMVGDANGGKSERRNGDHEEARATSSGSVGLSGSDSPSRDGVHFEVCESTSPLAEAAAAATTAAAAAAAAGSDKDGVDDAKGSNSEGRQNGDDSNSAGRQNGNDREGSVKRTESGGVSDIDSPPRRRPRFAAREDGNEPSCNRSEALHDDGDGGLAGPEVVENEPDIMVVPPPPQISPKLPPQVLCLQKEMAIIAKTCLESLLRYTEECVDRGEPMGEVRARAVETVRESPPPDMVEAMVVMETVDVFEGLPAVLVADLMARFGGPDNRATLDENQLLLQAIAHAL